MSQSSIDQALPAAIRRAADMEPRDGQGWTVRILCGGTIREVRLANQAQVAHLTLELERMGLALRVDGDDDGADFVFEPAAMVTG